MPSRASNSEIGFRARLRYARFAKLIPVISVILRGDAVEFVGSIYAYSALNGNKVINEQRGEAKIFP